jgi:hypothetical protein
MSDNENCYENLKIDKSVVCCLCVRDCARFLPRIFNNLKRLSVSFTNFKVVFVYDNCSDNSEILLNYFKNNSSFEVFVIHNVNNNSPHRTVRIANSRNICLNIVYDVIKNVDYHMMIDADDVNANDWNIDLLLYYLNSEIDNWDALSFNRKEYYDIWALLYENYKYHCWGFGYFSRPVINYIRNDIEKTLNKLKDKDDLFECFSAFNGFAIYKTKRLLNIKYDGYSNNFNKLLSHDEIKNTILTLRSVTNMPGLNISTDNYEACEHLYYHLTAIRDNNARIRISKECL